MIADEVIIDEEETLCFHCDNEEKFVYMLL